MAWREDCLPLTISLNKPSNEALGGTTFRESREVDLRLPKESSLELDTNVNLRTGENGKKYRFHGFEFHLRKATRKERMVQY